MTKSYQDRVEMRDGDVVLFRRPDVKRPVWHMRLHVRGMKDLQGNPLPYIQVSTGEVDLDEAKHIAQAKHDELKLKVRNKEPAKDVTFADLYQLWWTQKRDQLGVVHKAKGRSGVTKRVGWYEGHSRRYWLPYFGGKRISDLRVLDAMLRGETFTVTKRRWENDADGKRVAVERQGRVRPWFFEQDNGWYVQCRYGSRVLNLNGKSNSVFVDKLEEVGGALAAFGEAAKSGELDKAVLMVMKAKT